MVREIDHTVAALLFSDDEEQCDIAFLNSTSVNEIQGSYSLRSNTSFGINTTSSPNLGAVGANLIRPKGRHSIDMAAHQHFCLAFLARVRKDIVPIFGNFLLFDRQTRRG